MWLQYLFFVAIFVSGYHVSSDYLGFEFRNKLGE